MIKRLQDWFFNRVISRFFPKRDASTFRIGAKVALRGEVLPRDVLHSPASDSDCVYYQHSIEVWRQSRSAIGGDGFWQLVEKDEAIVEFYLLLKGTRVIVSPENCRVRKSNEPSTTYANTSRFPHASKEQREQEFLIRPGDIVLVEGWLDEIQDLFDEARGYREVPTCWVVGARNNSPVRIESFGAS